MLDDHESAGVLSVALGQMRLDLRRLMCFAAVSDDLSFTLAAKHLGIAQPWLSAQVRKLESELGMTLFDRSTRHVELTDGGRALVPIVNRLLREAARAGSAIDGLRRAQHHRLRVGAPVYSFHIPGRMAAIERFEIRYPSVELDIENGWTTELRARVLEGDLDVAFLLAPFDEDGLDVAVVDRSPCWVVMPKDHPLTAHEVLTLPHLAGERVASFKRSRNPALFDYQRGEFEKVGAEVHQAPEPTIEAVSAYALRHDMFWMASDWAAGSQILPRGRVMRRLHHPPLDSTLMIVVAAMASHHEARQFWRMAHETVVHDTAVPRARISA